MRCQQEDTEFGTVQQELFSVIWYVSHDLQHELSPVQETRDAVPYQRNMSDATKNPS
jgi:hypothetical protein